MGTRIGYRHHMARPPWTPSEEQRRLIAKVKRIAKRRDQEEAKYREALAACTDAEVPIARLAEELEVERKTIYRHLGRSMT